MGALFWVAFLPSTSRWQQLVAAEGAESEHLLAWHPWSGARIDLTKQIVAERGEDVMALARLVQCSNDVSNGALAVDGFSQGQGGASHAPGRGRIFGRPPAGEGRSGAATRQSRDGGSTSW